MDSGINAQNTYNGLMDELNRLLQGSADISSFEEVDLREKADEPSEEPAEEPEPKGLIPKDKLNILVDESVSRFSSAEWFEKARQRMVTIVGLGGIGSWTALLIARLRPSSLRLVDFDVVEAVNMAGQLYSSQEYGSSKVSAVSRMIQKYCDYYRIIALESRVDPRTELSRVTICGFDNMEARKMTFDMWWNKYQGDQGALFIDGRLSAEEFQVFCVTGKDRYLANKYRDNWLFDDSEAEETVCSYKQTSFCANMIASTIVNLFVNFVTNLCDPVVTRALPFMTCYDSRTMMLKTVMQ